MDLKRLEIFCRVVEQKSFSRAALRLGISQPSVSEHMRLLEESLGERLLDRLGREATPTAAGQTLLPYARRLLRLRDEALQALQQFRGELRGDLPLGASTIPGSYLLPQHLARFKQQHPAVRAILQIASSAVIVDRVMEGEYEVGVVGSRREDQRLAFAPLFRDRLVLAVPAGHRLAGRKSVSLEDLAGETLIVREPGSGTRNTLEAALKRAGKSLADFNVVAEMGSPEAIRQGVRAGIGAAILSSHAIEAELQHGELVAITLQGVDLERDFFLVRHARRELSPVAAAFAEFLVQAGEGPLRGG